MNQYAYRPPTWSMMPPVIKNLLIINVLVFFAQLVFQQIGGNPYFGPVERWFGLWPLGMPEEPVMTPYGVFEWGRFYLWQVVTYAFLHGSIGHIFLNMLGLWMFGMRIENVWGSNRFARYYFACVLGAAAAQLAVSALTGSMSYTVGASGGVLGVLLAFGLMYPEEPIYLYFFIPIKAKWLVLGLAVFSIYAGYANSDNVAHFAHLGGMVTGYLLIQYWRGKLPIGPRQRRSVY